MAVLKLREELDAALQKVQDLEEQLRQANKCNKSDGEPQDVKAVPEDSVADDQEGTMQTENEAAQLRGQVEELQSKIVALEEESQQRLLQVKLQFASEHKGDGMTRAFLSECDMAVFSTPSPSPFVNLCMCL